MKQTLLVFAFIISFISQGLGQDLLASLETPVSYSSITPNVEVFPNPAMDYIQLSNNQIVDKIFLYDMIGKKVKYFSYRSSDEKFYVGDLRKGIYLVQLLDKNNEIISTKRIRKN